MSNGAKNGIDGRALGKWKASVISCGTLLTPKMTLCDGFDPKLKLKLPYQAFLLRHVDTGYTVLIDNGQNSRQQPYGTESGPCIYWATEDDLLASLKEESLTPNDIDMVIYTHLHADHAGNAEYFPKTRTVVQRDEYDNLLNPCFREQELMHLYDEGTIPALKNNPNLLLVDGDMDLLEGICLIKTPGHTRGHQSLVVDTIEGVRVFAGDLFHLPPCAFPQMKTLMDAEGVEHEITPAPTNWRVMPAALVFDYYSYYASVDKVRAHMPTNDPKYLVCGHDASLKRKGI